MAQLKAIVFVQDEFRSEKSGKVYTSLFEPATGGAIKLVSDTPLQLKAGSQYDADLKVRIKQGQGGTQFIELVAAGSKFTEVKA